MTYEVERERNDQTPTRIHSYRITRNGRMVARYWHDHRGDEHGIEFPDGRKEGWPVGRSIDFLEGGGPESLRLTPRAIAYLDSMLTA